MEIEAIVCRIERIESDIQVLYERTNETKIWQATYGEKISNIENNVKKMTESIEVLLGKPQRRWDMVVASAISAVVGGTLMAIVSRAFYMAQ